MKKWPTLSCLMWQPNEGTFLNVATNSPSTIRNATNTFLLSAFIQPFANFFWTLEYFLPIIDFPFIATITSPGPQNPVDSKYVKGLTHKHN